MAPVFDHCIRQVASQTAAGYQDVEQVVRHQWKSVLHATKTCLTIELTGLGYLTCSRRKVERRLGHALRFMQYYRRQLPLLGGAKLAGLQTRIQRCELLIGKYQQKLSEHENRLERAAAGRGQQRGGQPVDKGAGSIPV